MRNAYRFAATQSRAGHPKSAAFVFSDTLWEKRLWQGRSMRHRHRLPQLDAARPFLTDGGLETTLIFHRKLDLPCFAAFDLLRHDGGRDELRTYFEPYVGLARDQGVGFVLDTATWRANPDWALQLGYSLDELDAANRNAVALAEEIRAAGEAKGTPIVINGVIGPRGDGYDPGELMSPDDAEGYHGRQIATFADSAADMVTAVTMTNPEEAIGIARAARAHGMPAVISFTVETDGRLPNGQPLPAAIERVDAETGGSVSYFMINCAHPSHFGGVLEDDATWRERIGGLRANASAKSHAELDEAEELDEGDPAALGAEHGALRPWLRSVAVLGGCCGTDCRHVEAIGKAWMD
jgi:S-methylmethionine-dependent homocysteine/selenocysteine methylase